MQAAITVRRIIGQGEGQVVGCATCGTVETLHGGATHNCDVATEFFAVQTRREAVSKKHPKVVDAVRL